MNTLITLLGIGVSLAALLWLSATDPKRRRSFGLPVHSGPRRPGLAWAIALLPGLFLPSLAGGPGLVLWLGSLTVIGWGLIAIPPGRGGALAARIDRAVARIGGWLDARSRRLSDGVAALRARLSRPAAPMAPVGLGARVAELEQRVLTLEAELARLRISGARDLPLAEPRDVRVA